MCGRAGEDASIDGAILRVSAVRQLDIAPFDGAVVGRVDAPPGSLVIDLHPGVRGSLTLDEAVDVARGDVDGPAEGEEDVGVVLTDALSQAQGLRRRGGGLGETGLVAHVLIDPSGEGEGLALRRAPGECLCDLCHAGCRRGQLGGESEEGRGFPVGQPIGAQLRLAEADEDEAVMRLHPVAVLDGVTPRVCLSCHPVGGVEEERLLA